ncbi:ABC transporter permease [Microbacterium invictum]|uniref:ABC-type transport system involved in multi-copper enzyme maturation permease subunit n=1 Tax=Microbacterium invictum TaxID=515415 RepID=A0AA40SPB9_9MICO|nr:MULTISPECIES: ABC transporter permease [Microbacterium]MBB4139948.1 ABC-type transport system involved in multi-copper enzyme maturation permease subunit [Microbacterium invictum]
MSFSRLWTIARLELLQRVRTVSWYVLLGVFALLLVGITLLAFLAYGFVDRAGAGVYSVVVNITLLLVLLVAPTLSGNSINGDRDAATLAPVQVTLATTGEILLGKFVAAWLTGLAFAAVTVPFLIIATFAGGVDPIVVLVSSVVLVVETGIIAAIGVAISGILARPLFSVATTYLIVAAFAIGSLIGFGLVGASVSSEATNSYRSAVYDPVTGEPQCVEGVESCGSNPEQMVCGEWQVDTYNVPRFDRVWWLLATNPFVILADATPTQFDEHGDPVDVFGWIKVGVRGAQQPPQLETSWDECAPWEDQQDEVPTGEEIVANSVPSWFVGLGVQVLLAVVLLWWAWLRTRTPARTLPPGTRIA